MSLGLTLTFEDLGAGAAFGELKALGANLRDTLMVPIGAALEASTKERFDLGQGPDGEAWVPSLRARLQGGKTLQDKGHLRDSIHYEAEADAVEIGTADIRAGIHQFGGTITAKSGGGLRFRLASGGFRTVQSVTMPARPFIGLSAQDRATVVDLAEEAVATAIGGFWGS